MEGVLSLLPPGERSAVAATTSIDLQWLADRSSSVWTGGAIKYILEFSSIAFTTFMPH